MGNMALLVSNLWATASRHKQRAVAAEDALRYSGVGRRERDRVADYYSHMAAFEHPGKGWNAAGVQGGMLDRRGFGYRYVASAGQGGGVPPPQVGGL